MSVVTVNGSAQAGPWAPKAKQSEVIVRPVNEIRTVLLFNDPQDPRSKELTYCGKRTRLQFRCRNAHYLAIQSCRGW